MGENVIFSLRDVSFSYPDGAPGLKNVTLDIRRGDFTVICGPSGSGKTTLLRQLKPTLTPAGERSGEIFFGGAPIETLDFRQQSEKIGFVLQSPENQIVTDKVWHELAFGLESLGTENQEIRRRVAEMASFFGIEKWFYKSTLELSGGQKQLLNLAAVMVMSPEAVILDEPTARLDPIAASELIAMASKINRELGTTVIMTEHRLDEVFPAAHRAVVMEGGRVVAQGAPRDVCRELASSGRMSRSMPTPVRIWDALEKEGNCPITVREGRQWLGKFAESQFLGELPPEKPIPDNDPAVKFSGVWFKYEKDSPDVLKGLELDIPRGSITAIMGGNGAGKTTALSLAAGILKPYRGSVAVSGRAALLPQDVQTVFTEKTLGAELCGEMGDKMAELCGVSRLMERHPYDLSGGEQQRAALAKILTAQPEILLLDEPTKGLDGDFKASLGQLLLELQRRGVTIVMVSHDPDFCGEFAEKCVMLFDGAAVSQGTPREFFPKNSFYTTAASRMARDVLPEAVTAEDVIRAFGGTVPEPPRPRPPEEDRDAPNDPRPEIMAEQKRPKKISRRYLLSIAVLLVLVPLTVVFGMKYLGNRKYYFISLIVILECMAPFFAAFEGRKPRARELVTVAVLCALGVAGRAAFFMVPQFKPVMALTIIAGAALGGETGFLVGAVTMLTSNMLFGQTPMTPWQMLAMGLVGFLAGIIFRGRPKKLPLAIFGAFCAVVVYGGIMNLASALTGQVTVTLSALLPYYAAGLPFDLIQAAATVIFLLLLTDPMMDKLTRIKTKYGLT